LRPFLTLANRNLYITTPFDHCLLLFKGLTSAFIIEAKNMLPPLGFFEVFHFYQFCSVLSGDAVRYEEQIDNSKILFLQESATTRS